jgi:hypothetical protein
MELEILADITKLPVEIPAGEQDDAEEQSLLGELGFGALIDKGAVEAKRAVNRQLCQAAGLIPLSDREMAVWQWFLPMAYFHREFKQYDFGPIPTDVLRVIKQVGQAQLFDSLEIRTPERTRCLDPALIGYIGREAYLLARWAESELIGPKAMLRQARRNAAWDPGALMDLVSLVSGVSAVTATLLGIVSLISEFSVVPALFFAVLSSPLWFWLAIGRTGLWWPLRRLD